MDAVLRLLEQGGPTTLLLVGGAVLAALAELAMAALAWKQAHRSGTPEIALLLAVGLALPLGLLAFGLQASVPDPGDVDQPRILALTAALRVRLLTGAAGLILALPLGLATCLWAGIAAERRARRAGERARLSATAEGYAVAGRVASAALDRSAAPQIGLGIGLLVALLVIGAPSVGLILSGLLQLEGLGLAPHLAGERQALYLALQAREAAVPLRVGAWIGAGGLLVVAALLGSQLHVGSSRRRNLRVAEKALEAQGLPRAATEAVRRAMEATGRPGPAGPLAIAAVLLVLAAIALALMLEARSGVPIPGAAEELASIELSTGSPVRNLRHDPASR